MNSAALLFKQADVAFKAGKYREAIAAYHKILDLPEEELDEKIIELVCRGTGECCLNLNLFDDAEKFLKSAIKRNQAESNYHYLLGLVYTKQMKLAPAIKELEKALRLYPDHPEIIRCLGWAVHLSGDRPRGLSLLKRSASLDPSNAHTFCDLAVAYLGEGQVGEAMICGEKAGEIAPRDPFVMKVLSDLRSFERGFKKLKNLKGEDFDLKQHQKQTGRNLLFRKAALEFTAKAKNLPGVREIALIGSTAGNDPYPNDLDLAVVLNDCRDISDLAKFARQISGRCHSWEVFLFDQKVNFQGQICFRKNCPSQSVDCSVPRCGHPRYRRINPGFKYQARQFFSSPVEILWPNQAESRLLGKKRSLGIIEDRKYPVLSDLHVKCIACGKNFVFSAAQQRTFSKKGFVTPKRCPDCLEEEYQNQLGS